MTGIKPTYGRVSRYGMIAFASSLDQGGLITQTAEDAALLLGAMAGFDPTRLDQRRPAGARLRRRRSSARSQGCKIGLLKEFFDTGLDAGIERTLIREALRAAASARAPR